MPTTTKKWLLKTRYILAHWIYIGKKINRKWKKKKQKKKKVDHLKCIKVKIAVHLKYKDKKGWILKI